jgi:putative Holliday junction resolvase
MKMLCIDYGRARIGLAACDVGELVASPFATITNKGWQKVSSQVDEIIKTNDIQSIIIGLPLNSDGSDSDMVTEVKSFAKYLARVITIPIDFHDERLTSVEAEEQIRASGVTNPARIKELVDKVAASMILSDYIKHKRGNKNG